MSSVLLSLLTFPFLGSQGDEQEADPGEARPEGPEREPGRYPRPGPHDPGVQEALPGQ